MNNYIWAMDEPGPYGRNSHITMTEEQIISHMKSREEYYNGATKNLTDNELLDQFVTCNWAYKEEIK